MIVMKQKTDGFLFRKRRSKSFRGLAIQIQEVLASEGDLLISRSAEGLDKLVENIHSDGGIALDELFHQMSYILELQLLN